MENLNLWEDINSIRLLREEKDRIELVLWGKMDRIIDQNSKLKKINQLGFNLVIHSNKEVAFIDYSKTIGDENYYFLYLNRDGGFEINPNNPLSEEDYKKLTKILELN